MDVKQLGVSLVHLHQDRAWKLRLVGHDIHANLVERREILGLLGSNVSLVEPPVFVSAKILGVENMLIVVLPKKIADAAMLVDSHGAVVSFPQSANPHIQHSIDGREISELRAVRRNLWVSALRIPKQHLARNQWSCELLLGSGRSNKKYRQRQDDNSTFELTHRTSKFACRVRIT